MSVEAGKRRAWSRALWVKVLKWVVTLAVTVLLWPAQFGGHLGFTVVSGHSMEPLLHTGDLVLTWPKDRYDKGDLVVYRVPDGQPGAGGHVVHRIIGGDANGYQTQGDNRDSSDIWTPAAGDAIGRVFVAAPRTGWLLAFMRSPLFLAGVCGVLVFAAVVVGRKEPAPECSETELREERAA